jgi:hypothetical protein
MSSQKRKLINKKAKVEIERYPLVEVEWIDIVSDASWQSLKDLERAQPARVITKGHLFSDGKGLVKVFSDNETLLERRLKLYRPLSAITDPRSLVPDFSFSFPVHWPTFREACWDLLQRAQASEDRSRFDTESWAQDNGKKNSLDELELSRS